MPIGQSTAILSSTAFGAGGAFCCQSCGQVVLSGVAIESNQAPYGGGIHLANGVASTAVISQCTFADNRAVSGRLPTSCDSENLSHGRTQQESDGMGMARLNPNADGAAEIGAGGGLNAADGVVVLYASRFHGEGGWGWGWGYTCAVLFALPSCCPAQVHGGVASALW